MPIQANKEIARRFVVDVWEKGDRTAAEAIVAADLVVHGVVVSGQPPGSEGQLFAAAAFRAEAINDVVGVVGSVPR